MADGEGTSIENKGDIITNMAYTQITARKSATAEIFLSTRPVATAVRIAQPTGQGLVARDRLFINKAGGDITIISDQTPQGSGGDGAYPSKWYTHTFTPCWLRVMAMSLVIRTPLSICRARGCIWRIRQQSEQRQTQAISIWTALSRRWTMKITSSAPATGSRHRLYPHQLRNGGGFHRCRWRRHRYQHRHHYRRTTPGSA